MTDKEKARAYDEAIKKAQDVSHTSEFIKITDLFPQLLESENEKIRKSIIHILQVGGYMSPEEKDKAFAYLEKQKEQKHPNGCFTCDEYKKGYEEGRRNGFTAGYNKAMKEVEQKEQKLADDTTFEKWLDDWYQGSKEAGGDVVMSEAEFKNWSRGIRNMYQQKSAEWSEEDEQRIAEIEFAVMQMNTKRVDTKDKCLAWLKSLRPQLKQKWSEEDEENINTLIEVVHERMGLSEKRKQYYEKWLKSLRHKPHTVSTKDATKFGNLEYERGVKDGIQSEKSRQWKPTEEQIYSLGTVVKGMGNISVGSVEYNLKALYEQLKKLM